MEFRNDRLSIEEAKEKDIVDYLYDLGFTPAKIKGSNYWYSSPLRNENTPSFKVDRNINRWFDHGIGKGGNVIDFALAYHQCSVSELLQKWTGDFSFHQPRRRPEQTAEPTTKLRVLEALDLTSTSLRKYLVQRRIDPEIAAGFCREIHYEVSGSTYFGIGFKNNQGGYEIRNPWFKGSSSPKGFTSIDNGAEQVLVFEGFMDFLSFRTLYRNGPADGFDYLVLNSLSFFDTARPFMERHGCIRLNLDRDVAGMTRTAQALALSPQYTDESYLYKNHKDFNDWVTHFGKSEGPP